MELSYFMIFLFHNSFPHVWWASLKLKGSLTAPLAVVPSRLDWTDGKNRVPGVSSLSSSSFQCSWREDLEACPHQLSGLISG